MSVDDTFYSGPIGWYSPAQKRIEAIGPSLADSFLELRNSNGKSDWVNAFASFAPRLAVFYRIISDPQSAPPMAEWQRRQLVYSEKHDYLPGLSMNSLDSLGMSCELCCTIDDLLGGSPIVTTGLAEALFSWNGATFTFKSVPISRLTNEFAQTNLFKERQLQAIVERSRLH